MHHDVKISGARIRTLNYMDPKASVLPTTPQPVGPHPWTWMSHADTRLCSCSNVSATTQVWCEPIVNSAADTYRTTPQDDVRRSITWSIISKAADRSSNVNTRSPLHCTSASTFTTAVSVERWLDCRRYFSESMYVTTLTTLQWRQSSLYIITIVLCRRTMRKGREDNTVLSIQACRPTEHYTQCWRYHHRAIQWHYIDKHSNDQSMWAERKTERTENRMSGSGIFLKAVERGATKSGRSHPLTKKVTWPVPL